MISEFLIENQTTLETASFGFSESNDFLYKEDGLDWGSAPASHSTYFYPGQIGSYIAMTGVKERDVTIVGYVFYIPTWTERQTKTREQLKELVYENIKEKKKKLSGLVNPNDYLKIIIGDYSITGKPGRSIQYGNTVEENNVYFCQFKIEVFCNNPLFVRTTASHQALSESSPRFHFPLILKPSGIIMSIRKDFLLLGIENEGDTEVGGIITFSARSEILNPRIENITTNQVIQITKTMQRGEKIIINTNEGDQKGIMGYINGEYINYLKYWDYENSWIKFPQGTSLVGYSTENDSEPFLDVSIDIFPGKYGLEEM